MNRSIIFVILIFFVFGALGFGQSIPNAIPKSKDKSSIDEMMNEGDKKVQAEAKETQAEVKEEPKKDQAAAEKEEPVKQEQEAKKEEIVIPVSKKTEIDKTEKEIKEKPLYKNYTDKGVIEIGGIIWGELRAFKGGSIEQQLWGNAFFSYFLANYFLLGVKGDGQYNLDSKKYLASGYLVAGAAFPLGEVVFMTVNINLGYAYSNMSASSSSLFSYGNEVGFKIKLKDNFLLGISGVYSFYTDFTQEFFNDKIKASIAFSGYF